MISIFNVLQLVFISRGGVSYAKANPNLSNTNLTLSLMCLFLSARLSLSFGKLFKYVLGKPHQAISVLPEN
jgi:hypothetical protein